MTKEFVYETLKTYYAKNFEEFENLDKESQKRMLNCYWSGFCDVATFAQYLGLSYNEVNKLYAPYFNKFWGIKYGDLGIDKILS